MLSLMEWSAALTGIAGAALLAIRCRWSPMGWLFFLASNVFWILYAFQTAAHGLLIQQLVFTATSLVGVYRWIGIPFFREGRVSR